jgi:hypothetical protein
MRDLPIRALPDVQFLFVKVDVLPAQPANLRSPQTGIRHRTQSLLRNCHSSPLGTHLGIGAI